MEKTEKIYKVSEITLELKNLIEQKYLNIWIQGEISGITFASSGHAYFQLKDEKSQISCVLFRPVVQSLPLKIENGNEIIAIGRLGVYEPRGSYQLIIKQLYPVGMGELQIRFEELKKKLKEEGLFDLKYKKKLPFCPKKIGVITSATGAALQDILSISQRRSPQIKILIAHSLVQGKHASSSLIQAIAELEKREDIDLIVITRGGGSMEDLWCFNDENLARKIFQCKKPILSAVGHQSDFTICDLVADFRAATPSEAAETVFPDRQDLLLKIQNFQKQFIQSIRNQLQLKKYHIKKIFAQLKNPIFIIQNSIQKIDELQARLELVLQNQIALKKNHLNQLCQNLKQIPLTSKIASDKKQLLETTNRMKENILFLFQSKQNQLLQFNQELKLYNPHNFLKQGYARIVDSQGVVVRSISQVNLKEILSLELEDGSMEAEVQKKSLKLN